MRDEQHGHVSLGRNLFEHTQHFTDHLRIEGGGLDRHAIRAPAPFRLANSLLLLFGHSPTARFPSKFLCLVSRRLCFLPALFPVPTVPQWIDQVFWTVWKAFLRHIGANGFSLNKYPRELRVTFHVATALQLLYAWSTETCQPAGPSSLGTRPGRVGTDRELRFRDHKRHK